MGNLAKVISTWSGSLAGLPGYTVWYFDVGTGTPSMAGIPGAVSNFWQAVKAYIPAGITITPSGGGDVIDPTNGQVVNTWSAAGAAGTSCTGTGSFSMASGSSFTITTAALNYRGHRIRGRAFVVPNTSNAYDTGGTLDSSYMGALYTACTALKSAAAAVPWSVWNRPVKAGTPPVVVHAGAPVPAVDFLIHDRVSVLRSRRG